MKNTTTIKSSNLIPGHISEKTLIWKDICTSPFTAALFTTGETWKQPKSPSTENWHKMWCIHNGILLSHKKEWIITIFSDMNGPREYCTLRNKSKTNTIWYHLYVESITNESIYKIETDSQIWQSNL